MKLTPAPADSWGGSGSDPRVKNGTCARTRQVGYPSDITHVSKIAIPTIRHREEQAPRVHRSVARQTISVCNSKLFNHLAQYAPEQVDTDEKKKYHFMNGLTTKLQDRLVLNAD
jgi:hypothetical protein